MKYSIMFTYFCLATLYVTSAKALDALDRVGNYVCSNQNQELIFTVRFNASYENGLIIKEAKSRRTAMTFNNYYGNGASDHWKSGAGSWRSEKNMCYFILSYHKKDKFNQRVPFKESKFRLLDVNTLGFEDANDNDYNDTVVDFHWVN